MKSLKKLLQYVKPYTLFAVLGPFLMCIEVAMDLLQPTIMQHIIDVGIANQDNAYVIKLGLLMLLTAFVGLIGGAGSSIYSTKAAVHFATDIRRDVFRKTEQFSNQNTDSFGTGKLITVVTNDIAAVQQALMMTLRVFVRGPLLFIGSVVIVWFTARELFPVLVVAIPILIAFIYYFSAKSGKLFARVQKTMDQVNTKLQETLAGIRVIKAFDRQDYEKGNFKTVNDSLMKRNMSAEQVILTLMPIMLFVVNIGVVAGLWMGAIKVNEGTLQVGVILAFINYLNIIMNGLMTSSHVLMQITRSFTSADRIHQVLDTEIDITEPESLAFLPAIRGEVEFRQVNFSYSKNGEYVLKNISFQAKAGETIGIIGSTGSGKSTLVKLIPRLYDPDSGAILIDGVNIKEYPLEKLRTAIGFVPQKATLFSGTIEENLRFGKEEATTLEMESVAQSAAASEFINRFDGKFAHELMQGATNLSGGQKQRLSMARAFIRKPKFLILDDSTSAIDALSETAVQQALKQDYSDTTVFIISAKISSIMDADQILVVDDGRIEASGTHEELLAKSRVYYDIYITQSGKEVHSYE
ncbi:ABC transporter ATP-binding protein [Peribacillus loiseleuriae]|uniref:Multidrug ABC transporter ATP-binding protein n=1 Tax=Peribacillus loiseleuriae TaxID=1679170 RepID=A0A0K9GTF0_9BACI|nr:ABC transporter ATP-binding protein [Peribacillus loiseleuriae]KMY49949.1 multidrug ABC transporter ATP-binding protein [Peribacillus loiseleuriae]